MVPGILVVYGRIGVPCYTATFETDDACWSKDFQTRLDAIEEARDIVLEQIECGLSGMAPKSEHQYLELMRVFIGEAPTIAQAETEISRYARHYGWQFSVREE